MLSSDEIMTKTKPGYLISISEALKSINNLSAGGNLLVGEVEVGIQTDNDEDDNELRSNASPKTRDVFRSILGTEHERADDTTDTTETNDGSRAESTLPVSTDIVGL